MEIPFHVNDDYYHHMEPYGLSEGWLELMFAHRCAPVSNSYIAEEWAYEFEQFPSPHEDSFVERRAAWLENEENREKFPAQYHSIQESADINSLMMLDEIEGCEKEWFWYSELEEYERTLLKFLCPERYPEPVEEPKKEPVKEEPKETRKCGNGNIFDWILEQGSSTDRGSRHEIWNANKPRLSANRMRHQIVINNLPAGTKEKHLLVLAEEFGAVVDIFFPINRTTGKQDVAFIEYSSPEHVKLAIKDLNQRAMGRSLIIVDVPKIRDNKSRR